MKKESISMGDLKISLKELQNSLLPKQ